MEKKEPQSEVARETQNASAARSVVAANFVTFLSPGTFVHESTTKPIKSWNVNEASQMAHKITERHGAIPFGFYFTTRERTETDLDSKQTKQSATYYIGSRIMTLSDVKREMPDKKILIGNMQGNNIERVLVNNNSWQTIVPFGKDDVLLDWKPEKARSVAGGSGNQGAALISRKQP